MMKEQTTPRRFGRPRSETAESHAAILDAVYQLLQEKPAGHLTMEAVSKRAGVGKPTLYKWWPNKASLIMTMFQERLVGKFENLEASSIEALIRLKMKNMIREFNGLFGKVMADLIAEGQSDPFVLKELYEKHIAVRRAATVADIEKGILTGEFASNTDAELLVDAIFGPVYYRMLLKFEPLTEEYGEKLVDQALRGVRSTA